MICSRFLFLCSLFALPTSLTLSGCGQLVPAGLAWNAPGDPAIPPGPEAPWSANAKTANGGRALRLPLDPKYLSSHLERKSFQWEDSENGYHEYVLEQRIDDPRLVGHSVWNEVTRKIVHWYITMESTEERPGEWVSKVWISWDWDNIGSRTDPKLRRWHQWAENKTIASDNGRIIRFIGANGQVLSEFNDSNQLGTTNIHWQADWKGNRLDCGNSGPQRVWEEQFPNGEPSRKFFLISRSDFIATSYIEIEPLSEAFFRC